MRKNYRLGIDVGTNSLGWSILLLDKDGAPNQIEAAGARIFSDGRDEKSKATLAATRRTARSARRRRDRFKQRQKFLLDVLIKSRLFPDDDQARKDLQKKNPLELRARALSEKLSLHEVGRALFHLNQRRGFQSNRKDRSEETITGKVSHSARLLLEQMDLIDSPMPPEEYKKLSKEDKKIARQKEAKDRKNALQILAEQKDLTYGSFLYKRYQQGEPTRARPGAGDDGKLYDVYPTRQIYEDEFNKIWAAQAAHYSDLMSDELRERVRYVIFTQRPLKPQKLGKCTYLPKEDRTFRAMPSFQRYRIYQEVNNLDWATSSGKHFLTDHREARDAIINLLEHTPIKEKPTGKNAQVSFHKMKIILKEMELAEGKFDFNFETPKRKGFDGDLTAHIMQHEDYVGSGWHDWPLEKQDSFIAVILDDNLDDKKVCAELMRVYGLSSTAAEKCMNAPLVDGTANVSLKAAQLMLEKMRDGAADENGGIVLPIQNVAADVVAEEMPEFINPMRRPKTDEGSFKPIDALPYYGEAFQDGRHIIPGDRLEEDRHDERKFFGGVTNPTVHIALNQIRQVVNELIGDYGHPNSIAIELGRNLPEGKNYRYGLNRAQEKNQKRNLKWDNKLHEMKKSITPGNRLRFRLWEEQGYVCPYCLKGIKISDLFESHIAIDHIIPKSKTLDDSRANKVICHHECNVYKGNKTPWEAFHITGYKGHPWDAIFNNAKNIRYEITQYNRNLKNRDRTKGRWEDDVKSKQWRFQEDAKTMWESDNDFLARHLNDTRYIGRLAREYLECICHIDKIDVLTGRLTALLRGHWGLNSVLRDNEKAQGGELPKKKNRDDHRHHAVDAIVIGMISRSMLQKVATAANRAEELQLETIFEKHNGGKSAIDPWGGFRGDVREAIQNIIVSHKPRRKKIRYKETKDGRYIPVSTDGQLHNDTAYGIVSDSDSEGPSEVVTRKPVDWFETEDRIESIRSPYLRKMFMREFQLGGKERVASLAESMHIRSLRRTEPLKVIPIKDKEGKVYKAYKGDSNWGIEIYEYPQGHIKSRKWEGIVVSRFDANQHNFKPGQTYKPHPAARLVMRLQINDCVEIEKNNKKRIMRLQHVSSSMIFAEHYEANVDARDRDKENPFTYYSKTANKLKSVNARKVHISPSGKVNYEIRRKPRRKISSP